MAPRMRTAGLVLCLLAGIYFLTQSAHAQSDGQPDDDAVLCANYDLSACQRLSNRIASSCTLSAAQCMDQQIAAQQVTAALFRTQLVCDAAPTSQDCAVASQRFAPLLPAFRRTFNVPEGTRPVGSVTPIISVEATNPFGGGVYQQNCSGTVSDPLDVSRRIVTRVLEQFSLVGAVSQQHIDEFVSLLNSDAITARDVIRRVLTIYEGSYSSTLSTERAVRFLYARLFNTSEANIPPHFSQELVSLAQKQGLPAAADRILDSPEYLTLVGEFVVPGRQNYLPCKVEPPEATLYVQRRCSDGANPDAELTQLFAAPRGYKLFFRAHETTRNPSAGYRDGYFSGARHCFTQERRLYLTVLAKRLAPKCWGGTIATHGPSSWMGVQVHTEMHFFGYATADGFAKREPANTCSAASVTQPAWAAKLPICDPVLPNPGSCTLSSKEWLDIEVSERNRCGETGATIGSYTLRNADRVTINSTTGVILYRWRTPGSQKFSNYAHAICAPNVDVAVPPPGRGF